MAYRKNVWNQIKGIDADRLIKALKKDSWTLDSMEGSSMVYIKKAEGKRVSVHYHSKKTFGRKLLTGLLDDIGWKEKDLKRLKLVKK